MREDDINKIPLMSICIPTYNRFEKLMSLVSSILKSNSYDFEILILDNCSNDETKNLVINDDRVRIIRQTKKVSGNQNCIDSLFEARSKFAMLCLDKDYIFGDYLSTFLTRLKIIDKDDGIACGFCEIDSKKSDRDFIVGRLIEDSCFTCKHPTGYFFKRNHLESINKNVINQNNYYDYFDMAYGIELFYAHCLTYGKECIYDAKLVAKHKEIEFSDEKSLTYGKGKKPLFFLPEEQRKYYYIFVNCLNEMDIDANTYNRILKRLIFRTLYRGSIIYWTLPKYVVEHYEIKYRGFRIINIMKDLYFTIISIAKCDNIKVSKFIIVIYIISGIFEGGLKTLLRLFKTT